jgi:hypothetical protein
MNFYRRVSRELSLKKFLLVALDDRKVNLLNQCYTLTFSNRNIKLSSLNQV